MKVVVRTAKGKGRGVFASEPIFKGELIEVCPVLPIPKREEKYINMTILSAYWYGWGKTYERGCIAFGYGSLYNHSYSPNARYRFYQKQKQIRYYALRDIKKGEEITINYNYHPESKKKLWFDVK
jgi:SET domain-containing protein